VIVPIIVLDKPIDEVFVFHCSYCPRVILAVQIVFCVCSLTVALCAICDLSAEL